MDYCRGSRLLPIPTGSPTQPFTGVKRCNLAILQVNVPKKLAQILWDLNPETKPDGSQSPVSSLCSQALRHRNQERQQVSPARPALPWGHSGRRVTGLGQERGQLWGETRAVSAASGTEGTAGTARDCSTQAKPTFIQSSCQLTQNPQCPTGGCDCSRSARGDTSLTLGV